MIKSFLVLLFGFSCVFATQHWTPSHLKRNKIYQSPPKNLVYYHFDYPDLLSTLFWVRLLQDMEVCHQREDRELPQRLQGGSQVVDQILTRKMPSSKCHLSWVYRMVDGVTDLAPDFYAAYEVGGLFLSILVDDREGAWRIYQKGLQYFPENWQLLYQASYHSLFEMQKPEEAARLLVRAGKRGAPKWVFSLAARLYSKLGRAQFAKTVLESVLARNPKGVGVNRVRERLEELNKILKNQ